MTVYKNTMIQRSGIQCPGRVARIFALSALIATAIMQMALAQGTHLWTQSRMEEFEKGTPQGVMLTSDGYLREGPGVSEVATTPSTFVWSVAVDAAGTAYVGTASPATVLRIGADGKAFTLFETKDVSVQAVQLGSDGALYAATLPSGKVYKLDAHATAKQDDTNAAVVFDAAKLDDEKKVDRKTHYIWALTFDAGGRLYIAAGGPAAVYRVNAGKVETFFQCDEQHIRALAWDTKGNLIAGTDGSGLVYRISPVGKGYVLFDAPRREITSVAVGTNGTIYAASAGDKSRNPLPPLPVLGVGSVTISILQPGSMQAANASTSLPEGTEIYALTEGQAPRRLWTGKDEVVYAMATRGDDLLALSGNRGRVFQIAADGAYSDVAHLDAQQGLAFAIRKDAVWIGTGNTGKLIRLGTTAEKHEYASDVFDAGALTRFGRVEVQPDSKGYELWTRTGNVEQPVRGRKDWGWSEWELLKDGRIASPEGRYLQWKAVLSAGAKVGGVSVNYLSVNAAPVVDDLVVVAGAKWNAQSTTSAPQMVNITFGSSSAGSSYDSSSSSPLQAVKDKNAVTVRWAAHDENGDDLRYSVYLRGDGETAWRLLKNEITDKAYSFDATMVPDGGYQIRVVASDAPSHSSGEALTGFKVSERFEVDTTAPVISGLKTEEFPAKCAADLCGLQLMVSFDAEDASSAIVRAEYSLDAGQWQHVEPAEGISDSKKEHYSFKVHFQPSEDRTTKDEGQDEHLVTVRVYDRHDNVSVAKTFVKAAVK